MIKQLFTFFIVISLISPTFAESPYEAGLITPNSPLWNLDLKIEEIQERFAWNDEHRLTIQLRHMNERIGEMQTGEKLEQVTQHYMSAIERIEANTVRYEAAQRARAVLQQHKVAIGNINGELPEEDKLVMNTVQNRVITGQAVLEQNAEQSILDEQMWWSEKVAQYDILTVPTETSNFGDFEKFTSQLDEGITVFEVIRSDEVTLQSYIVRNEGGVVTIKQGTTDNYVKKYTVTVNELKMWEALL